MRVLVGVLAVFLLTFGAQATPLVDGCVGCAGRGVQAVQYGFPRNDRAVRRCVFRNYRSDPSRPWVVACQSRFSFDYNTDNDFDVRRCVVNRFRAAPVRPYIVECQAIFDY